MTTQLKTALTLAYDHGRTAAEQAAERTEPPDPTLLSLDDLIHWVEIDHPAADNYLPAMPTLSGEWADSETPDKLFRAVHMEAALEHIPSDRVDDDEICEAWERGVNDHFHAACAARLRRMST